jgi:hypothetical protein
MCTIIDKGKLINLPDQCFTHTRHLDSGLVWVEVLVEEKENKVSLWKGLLTEDEWTLVQDRAVTRLGYPTYAEWKKRQS